MIEKAMTAFEFKEALNRLGLRQVAFAETLGVHRVTVSRWATGELAIPRYVVAYLELAMQLTEAPQLACESTQWETRR